AVPVPVQGAAPVRVEVARGARRGQRGELRVRAARGGGSGAAVCPPQLLSGDAVVPRGPRERDVVAARGRRAESGGRRHPAGGEGRVLVRRLPGEEAEGAAGVQVAEGEREADGDDAEPSSSLQGSPAHAGP